MMFFSSKPRRALTLLFLGLIGGSSGLHPALAHTPSGPADPALDYLSNKLATLGMIGLCGIAFFIGIGALVSAYEKRQHLALDTMRVRGGTWTATAIIVLLLWHFNAPTPLSLAQAGHIDTPRHGGQIQAVGNNHVETVLGKDGSVAVYVMGITETIAYPLREHDLWGQARAETESASVLLHATPQKDDPKGQSSVFAGQVPANFLGKPLTLSLSLPLGSRSGKTQFSFTGTGNAVAAIPVHDTAPVRVAAAPLTAEERALYLKPGVLYTEGDIAANGNTSPEIKFAGLMANHHLNPKKGTYTCPITKTQANTNFPWIIGGKKYLFCCPPCIAEFVKQAKTNPKSIHEPQDYIQK